MVQPFSKRLEVGFIIYTMCMTLRNFSHSFFGRFITLISILFLSYYNLSYGVVLAGLCIIVMEIGDIEGFTESEVEGFTDIEGFTESEVEGFTESEVEGFTESEVEGFTESELEGFQSKTFNSIKSNYRRKKRKAHMIKDGFTNKINTKVERIARKYGL